MILFTVELVFGFSPLKYEIHESAGYVTVNIFFVQGIPGDYQLVVFISTNNGTATGKQTFQNLITY